MASTTWKRSKLIYNIKPFRPPPSSVVGDTVSIHSAWRPDLKVNITAPTGPNLLLVLFTKNKYLHNKK
jgi:hypothetical protein